MKLTIGERIRVGNLLPKESDITTLKIIRDLEGELSFSEDDIKDNDIRVKIEQGNSYTTWDNEESTKDINFGEIAKVIVVEALKELQSNKKLKMEDISIYEKFVENKQ